MLERARVYRSTVARLNYWALDRPDLQHAVSGVGAHLPDDVLGVPT